MFVKLTNGKPSKFPYTLGEFRRDNPNTSFPKVISDETLAEFSVYRVSPTSPPQIDNRTHYVTQWVELVNGTWLQTWNIQQLDEEQAAANVRSYRDRLLQESDWTQLADSPLNADAKMAWALYRETLRMVPQQAGFPWDVQWPPVPGDN